MYTHVRDAHVIFEDTKMRLIKEKIPNKLFPFTMIGKLTMKKSSIFTILSDLSKPALRLLGEIDLARQSWNDWIAVLPPCTNPTKINSRNLAFNELKNKQYAKRVPGKRHQYMLSPAVLVPYSTEKTKEIVDKWNSLEPVLPKLGYPENMV